MFRPQVYACRPLQDHRYAVTHPASQPERKGVVDQSPRLSPVQLSSINRQREVFALLLPFLRRQTISLLWKY